MRVLIACEFSGRVRDAFALRGHDAWSCDLLPSETPGQHIQGDALRILDDGWDLLIAHPPCQFLSYACPTRDSDPSRRPHTIAALSFFASLFWCNVKRVAVENPLGYANKFFRRPSQRIDPFLFGDYHRKRTFLWLRGLPPLVPTAPIVAPPPPLHITPASGKNRYYSDRGPHGRARSRTFPGIAAAMAAQWGR